jgi:hypothetical protein
MSTDFMQDGEYKCYNTLGITNIEDIKIDDTTYDEKFIMLNTDKIIHKIKELYKEKFFYVKDELISRINYPKQYPVTQIYSALTMLIDNETDYLIDMYGRNGRLVNIGKYYLFQPIELMNPEISLFERTTPIHYKNDSIRIKMELPSVLKEEILKTNVQVDNDNTQENVDKLEETYKILEDLHEMYTQSMKMFTSGKSVNTKDPLYSHVGRVMYKLKETKFADMSESVIDDLKIESLITSILISHLCDHMKIREKITVFQNLHAEPGVDFKDSVFFEHIKEYFKKKEIQITSSIGQSFSAMLFYDPNIKNKDNRAVFYVKYGESKWKLAELEDKKDINTYLNNNVRNIDSSSVSRVFGFMGYSQSSNSDVAFKLKDNTNSRSTGYKCSEVANKNKKVEILLSILKLGYFNDSASNDEIEEKLSLLKSKEEKTFGMKEICILVEFMTRYYDNTSRNGKRWFFDYEQQNILQDILKVV